MSIRLVFNSDGFRQILQSDGVHNLVQQTAEEIAEKANANNTRGGQGFEARTQIGGYGGGRYIGFVTTADNKAKIAESEDKALTRALS
ncbi:MAG: hypothetical protein IIY21_12840 [Clostridiales bacterium]|nr:hypothetical protein [Clostridiales bacterium]